MWKWPGKNPAAAEHVTSDHMSHFQYDSFIVNEESASDFPFLFVLFLSGLNLTFLACLESLEMKVDLFLQGLKKGGKACKEQQREAGAQNMNWTAKATELEPR